MYSMDCLVGVVHMLVFPGCGYDEMMECLPCVCVCFVHLLVWIIRFTEKLSETLLISLQYYVSLMTATMHGRNT